MAPRTLEELKRRLQKLNAPGSDLKLGKRALAALTRMMDNPEVVAVTSISALASEAGVNASTLSRLVRKLGFENFAEFQLVFRKHLARTSKTSFYSDLAGQLVDTEQDEDQRPPPSLALMTQVAEEETANIAQMLKSLDLQALEQTVELLASAPRVRVYGLRQAYTMANLLAYAMGLLRSDVSLLGNPHHGVAHGLTELTEQDVLVVIGASPYTRGTVAAARIAANHGMKVVAITDSHGSPLAAEASVTFVAPTSSTWYSNSMAAFLVFIEGLMAMLAGRLGRRGLASLKRHEQLIDEVNHEL
ncbi:MurR/RpiR family transcriptional regulator [Marinospirillum alkaliphilum]|uniref:Transcriptional regulator, RpiR family n=1 Tax=Marinospirillum alkaliphilum DSM 21637 TaxID=1122209 RepID=A0A1K1UE20_9GAMM|nr:MurR/RpiR family transcriptional regulator [Marinospirillum alkaliphilum]SFX10852.1 transcriptional regulator, RpiR family [Marinospirillum alkaliphilum DSM 21637]